MNDAEEFYIGWEAKTSARIGKTVRRTVIGLLGIAVGAAICVAVSQRLIGVSTFEWGQSKHFTGILRLTPYPRLLVHRPGVATTEQSQFSSYTLVAQWKFGLNPSRLAEWEGKPVTVKGALIYRENQTMIETRPDWIQPTTNAATLTTKETLVPLGKQTLVGEIVDSKCFMGVMNPGQLTPHRACAIRCISGGVPPVLVVRSNNAPPSYFLLVSAEGKPVNKQVLSIVAEPVSITGEVERQGDLLILRADPSTYRRL